MLAIKSNFSEATWRLPLSAAAQKTASFPSRTVLSTNSPHFLSACLHYKAIQTGAQSPLEKMAAAMEVEEAAPEVLAGGQNGRALAIPLSLCISPEEPENLFKGVL